MYYRVNIDLPRSNEQNEALIKYVEPLKAKGLIKGSKVYELNLSNFKFKQEPVWPGSGYMNFFWFNDRELAQKFINDWEILAIKRETYSSGIHEYMDPYFTEIKEVEDFSHGYDR